MKKNFTLILPGFILLIVMCVLIMFSVCTPNNEWVYTENKSPNTASVETVLKEKGKEIHFIVTYIPYRNFDNEYNFTIIPKISDDSIIKLQVDDFSPNYVNFSSSGNSLTAVFHHQEDKFINEIKKGKFLKITVNREGKTKEYKLSLKNFEAFFVTEELLLRYERLRQF